MLLWTPPLQLVAWSNDLMTDLQDYAPDSNQVRILPEEIWEIGKRYSLLEIRETVYEYMMPSKEKGRVRAGNDSSSTLTGGTFATGRW
jgi:hypothetical protein